MNTRKLVVIAVAALAIGGGGAVTVWSASTPTPTTVPADSPLAPWQRPRGEGMRPDGPPRPEGMRGMRGGGWWRENGTNPATRPVGADEWQYVDRFMNTYSTHRWAKFRELPDDDRKQRLRGFVAQRYRAMQELKQNDPKIYDVRLQRLQIEDKIFDLGWKLNHDADNVQQTRTALQAQLRLLIENRIQERTLRVAQLEQRLSSEKERLTDESTNKEKAIDASMNAIEKQRWPGMAEMVPPIALFGGGGAGVGAGGGSPRPAREERSESREPANTAPANTSEQGRP